MSKKAKIFDELLTGFEIPEHEVEKRVRSWLSSEYDITVKDNRFYGLLADVHSHDGGPLHFHQVRVSSSLGRVAVQLVKLPDGWHLVAAIAGGQPVPVHPKSESGSWNHPSNRAVLMPLRTVLKSGKVEDFSYQVVDSVPGLDGVFVPSVNDPVEDSGGEPVLEGDGYDVASGLGDLFGDGSGSGQKSINVDLSGFFGEDDKKGD